MSESIAAESEFDQAREEALSEEADPPELEAEGEAEDGDGEPKVKATDWEKIAHDAKGQVAKERSRRKAEAQARRELETRLEKLEQSKGGDDPLEALAAQLRDDDEDPMSDIATTKKLIKEFLAAQKAERERESGQTQQQRQFEALRSTMADHEADFAADHPDYNDAAKHYRTQRQEELEELGYSGQALQTALARDLIGVVQTALSSGRDPAEAVYNLAKRRGFAAGTSETDAKLAKIGKAAEAGARPNGGGKPSGALTWDAVSKLKGAARDAAWSKLREQERRAG